MRGLPPLAPSPLFSLPLSFFLDSHLIVIIFAFSFFLFLVVLLCCFLSDLAGDLTQGSAS